MDEASRADLQKKAKFWFCGIWVSVAFVLVPPLLGLMGTVTGMVRAFDTMSIEGGANPEELAENISFALITTAGGLVVALIGLIVFFVALVRYLVLSKTPGSPESN